MFFLCPRIAWKAGSRDWNANPCGWRNGMVFGWRLWKLKKRREVFVTRRRTTEEHETHSSRTKNSNLMPVLFTCESLYLRFPSKLLYLCSQVHAHRHQHRKESAVRTTFNFIITSNSRNLLRIRWWRRVSFTQYLQHSSWWRLHWFKEQWPPSHWMLLQGDHCSHLIPFVT